MSTQTIQRSGRPRPSRVAHFRLDVAEWLVLRSAILSRAPGAATPAGFTPEAFGLDPERPLTAAESERAWTALVHRGLATHVPDTDDVTALTPGCILGMRMLIEPDARVDVSSWAGELVVNQTVAWSAGRTASVARRRRRRTSEGEPVLEQEPVIEVSLSSAGGLLSDVMRALPPHAGPSASTDRSPVRVGWPESAAIAQALRSGRADVAAHLSGLPSSALSVLGAVATTLTGGACISAQRRYDDDAALGFHGVWLWTEEDVVELVDASSAGVTLRRTDLTRVRTSLLSAVTGLLHAEEVL